MNSNLALVAKMFARSKSGLELAIEGIPDNKWLIQPSDQSNHLTWIVGHVIVHRAIVLKMLGSKWSAPWESLFARGAERVSADRYPAATEIRQACDEVSACFPEALANATDEQLAAPAPEEFSFDGKVSGCIALLATHDSYHVGQAVYLRKYLGYGQAVG